MSLTQRFWQRLSSGARDSSEGLAGLHTGKLLRSRKGRGRPRRGENASAELISKAPFPELVSEPADHLPRLIRRIDDVDLLRRAHAFEDEHDRRSTVLGALEERLRRLGAPLGGPNEPPRANYDDLSTSEITAWITGGEVTADKAAEIYAWEWARRRRGPILDAAETLAGKERATERVKLTSPRSQEPPEPFPGYLELSTSPSERTRVREELGAQETSTLRRALEYELETRNRVVMIRAIETALRRKN